MPEKCLFNENGWKKMPISHGFEKTTRIETKHFVFLAIRASTYVNVMGKSVLLSHMKDKHEEYVKNHQGNEKTTKR